MLRFVTFALKRQPAAHHVTQLQSATSLGLLLTDNSVLHLNSTKESQFPVSDMLSLLRAHDGREAMMAHARKLINSPPQQAIVPASEVVLHAPIIPPRNIMCIGKNYLDHLSEVTFLKTTNDTTSSTSLPVANVPIPGAPIFFTKSPDCAIGHLDYIEAHEKISKYTDYEVELAVVLGKDGRDIPVDRAMEYVFGYTAANDVTSRDLQKTHSQWFKGKTLDRSCPLGPCIGPRCALPPGTEGPTGHPDLGLQLWLNGQLKQSSRTGRMMVDIPRMIASLSEGFTLRAGDVILTGTPQGVGYAAKPPRTLRSGDVVRIEIEHIGVLQNDVR